jgi:hypothetical protein
MRHAFTTINAQQGNAAIGEAWVWAKPLLLAGHRLHWIVTTETRSVLQNNLMWSCLADVARQVEWHGQKLDEESWKDMATAALKRQRVVPGIDGGFVVLGMRTSKMTIAEMVELIDFLHAFGDSKAVQWSKTSLGRHAPAEMFEETAP